MRRIVPPVRLETARLVLRQWRQEDYVPYAAMNADKAVTAFLTIMLDRRESEAVAAYFRAMIAWRGWGIWAVERKLDGVFIGSVGLHVPRVRLPLLPVLVWDGAWQGLSGGRAMRRRRQTRRCALGLMCWLCRKLWRLPR